MAIKVPQFVQDNAARGLKYLEDGHGGSGLVDQTITDAKALAQGEVTEEKIRKIGPWIARHLVDLDAPANSDPKNLGYPGPGLVAMLLWGGGTTPEGALRTKKWADRETAKLNTNKEGQKTMTERITTRRIELRANTQAGTFEGLACKYGIEDSYGTVFQPNCFTNGGLDAGTYPLLWMHDSNRPVGTFTAEERADGLYIMGQWDDSAAGQEARAAALSGSAADLSVGFTWFQDPNAQDDNLITMAQLREVSQVTSRFGAVPGSKLTAVRSIDGALDEIRAGRVLSAANEDALNTAVTLIQSVLGQVASPCCADCGAGCDGSCCADCGSSCPNYSAARFKKVATRAMATDGSDLVEELNEAFADVFSFYLRAHGAHWNVVGPNFAEYHRLFEEIYSDVYESIDPLAESLRKLGVSAPFSLPQIIELRDLGDSNVGNQAPALAADLLAANDIVIDSLADVLESATAANQQGIINFIAERIDFHQKWKWQLSASLGAEVKDPSIDLGNPADLDDQEETGKRGITVIEFDTLSQGSPEAQEAEEADIAAPAPVEASTGLTEAPETVSDAKAAKKRALLAAIVARRS
jgi:HK97 family phage prohead protease